jgi:hypothetical protein
MVTSVQYEIRERYAATYSLGAQILNRQRGSWLRCSLGRDEQVSASGLQAIISGVFPLGPAPGSARLDLQGRVVISLTHRGSSRPDLATLSFVVSK